MYTDAHCCCDRNSVAINCSYIVSVAAQQVSVSLSIKQIKWVDWRTVNFLCMYFTFLLVVLWLADESVVHIDFCRFSSTACCIVLVMSTELLYVNYKVDLLHKIWPNISHFWVCSWFKKRWRCFLSRIPIECSYIIIVIIMLIIWRYSDTHWISFFPVANPVSCHDISAMAEVIHTKKLNVSYLYCYSYSWMLT
jgi:hypothetical protein